MSLCVPADLVAAPLMRRAFIDSARSLFGLAARMQGKSWFGIARSAEIDARAVMWMRTPPSIGMLARLSGGLAFGTATTVGIAADLAESMHHDDRAIAGNPALLHAAIARADTADDPSALSHLAPTVWNGAREPGDLALAHLIASRASDGASSALPRRSRCRPSRSGWPIGTARYRGSCSRRSASNR